MRIAVAFLVWFGFSGLFVAGGDSWSFSVKGTNGAPAKATTIELIPRRVERGPIAHCRVLTVVAHYAPKPWYRSGRAWSRDGHDDAVRYLAQATERSVEVRFGILFDHAEPALEECTLRPRGLRIVNESDGTRVVYAYW